MKLKNFVFSPGADSKGATEPMPPPDLREKKILHFKIIIRHLDVKSENS